MGKAYYSKEDAIRRLNETICMYDGSPVYVSLDVPMDAPEHTVLCYPLKYFYATKKANPSFKVLYTDPKFNYKQFPLGYGFSDKSGGMYFARIPDRKQSQGLSHSTLRIDGRSTGLSGYFLSEAMENCIRGIYPTMEWAIEHARMDRFSVIPFHRKMAIAKIDRGLVCLKYRRRAVAILDGKKSFKLLDTKDKNFLKNILSKEGVPVT